MSYKKHFPIFKNSKVKYFDSAATTQKPLSVIKAQAKFYLSENANIHRGVYKLSELSTKKYDNARKIIADFINADEKEVIFTKGTTESINLLAYTLPKLFKKKNEIVITEMEHHSNMVPWQFASKENKMKLRYIPIKENYELDYLAAEKIINKNTAIVSITHVNNSLGTVNNIKKIIDLAKKYGAIVIIDAAQSIAHKKIDVKSLNCDFLTFSGHKIYGPTGIGVLYGKSNLLKKMPPFHYGGDMINSVKLSGSTYEEIPNKFEAGTQNIAGAICLAKAIKFVDNLGLKKIENHEKTILKYAIAEMKKIPGIRLYLPEKNGGIISFNVKGIHSHDLASLLDDSNIAIRAGHHCTMPLMNKLKIPGTARVSISIYNTKDDVDKLVKGIKKALEVFRK